jgi:hypothetical protein
MKIEIQNVREGVAEFAGKAGISQVEAACELLLVLGNAFNAIEDGLAPEEAVVTAVETFTARWGKVF